MWVFLIGTTTLLLAAGLALGALQNRQQRSADETRERLTPADTNALAVADSATLQRADQYGYLITRDPRFRERRDTAGAEISARMSELRALVARHDELVRGLDGLEAALATWGREFLHIVPGDVDARRHLTIGAPVGDDAAYQEIRAQVKSFRQGVVERLQANYTEFDFLRRGSVIAVLAVAVVQFTLVAASVWATWRRLGRVPATPWWWYQAGADAPSPTWSQETRSGVRGRMRQLWESRRDRETLRQQASAAAGLRGLLLPLGTPGAGMDASASLVPAEGVLAGDFYDTLTLPGGRTGLLLGDVTGHGVDAGTLAGRVKCAMLSALYLGNDAGTAIRAARTALSDDDERFVTLAVVIVDPVRRTLEWANAGHEPPLVRRADGDVVELCATGVLVSAIVTDIDTEWDVRRTGFGPGDLLVLYTDGLTEARNRRGEEFGDARVVAALRETPVPTAAGAVDRLNRRLLEHGVDWTHDDVTIVAATVAAPEDAGARDVVARHVARTATPPGP